MVTENILLSDFKDKIEGQHKDVEELLHRVAGRQKWIVLGIILFNVVAYFILQMISGGSGKIFGIDNPYVCFILTILLAFIPFPDAIRFGRNELNKLKLDLNDINPHYDFNGEWKYKTTFHVDSENDGSKEYEILYNNINNFPEAGSCEIKQNALVLKIEYANTDSEDKIKTPSNTDPFVRWQSSPIALSASSVEWHFEGRIWWKGEVVFENRFVGIEHYTIVKTDPSGKPQKLDGELSGYIHMGSHCYTVSARSSFERKE